MTETVKTPQELEKEFYSKPLILSYSGLNKLLFSPKLYYKHYILQQREEKLDSYLIDGKVIHCLLLDDGSFDKQFILMPAALPGDSIRKVVDKVYQISRVVDELAEVIKTPEPVSTTLESYGNTILQALKEINLHQSLKTDEQRLTKIITEETISYFEFLKVKGNKDLIDSETIQRCNEAVDVIKNNSKATELLGTFRSEMENTKVHNELMLSIDQYSSAGLSSFGLRGAIDNMKIDFDAKIVYINDLKTTGKTIADFEETVKYYNYNLQAAIYQRLVTEKLKDSIDADWKIVFHFIVVDKYNQVYCFEVNTVTMQNWQNELDLKLAEAEWHYKNNKYNLPFKFETGQVTL